MFLFCLAFLMTHPVLGFEEGNSSYLGNEELGRASSFQHTDHTLQGDEETDSGELNHPDEKERRN